MSALGRQNVSPLGSNFNCPVTLINDLTPPPMPYLLVNCDFCSLKFIKIVIFSLPVREYKSGCTGPNFGFRSEVATE